MSDNVNDKEQQKQMEEIFICDDIWLEVFALFSPLELGHTMALISDRFDALVDLHFKHKKWSLGSLQILRAIDGNGAIVKQSSGEQLPIPQGPIPGKVIGFEKIEIRYIDRSVIEFLQSIRRLFTSTGTTVDIGTSADQSHSWEIIWQKIWPNLRSVDFRGLFPVFPADDNTDASSRQAMAKWLLTPREDGLPKMLHCDFYSPRGGMEEAFVNASESANFIIRPRPSLNVFRPCKLKNKSTGERLTFQQMDGDKWLLVRCPIERDEDKWAKWEKEAIERKWSRQWNCIFINFNDSDIGDGMGDANVDGPSEPNK
uniref:F-box domain-containing protein n=1 Tax=Globodera rostochiensis TaxID=31243 RepID=A0A914HEP3_GLORO